MQFFLEVAEAQSFTKASEKLHVVQPALSISIRKLEEELDTVLFNRQGRTISLTAEGAALARHAHTILRQVAQARQELDDLRGLLKGEVRVGVTPMLGSRFFQQIVVSFKRRYPELRLSINGEQTQSIQAMIAAGDLDVGVIAGKVPEGLASHLLVRDEVMACVYHGHPLAGRKMAPFSELASQPLIHFSPGSHLRELIDQQAAQAGVVPTVVVESNLFSISRSLVLEELGLAFFPKLVMAHDTAMAGIACDPPIFMDLSIVWKKNAVLSRANRVFVDFVIQEVDDYYLLVQAAGTFPLP